MANGSKIGITVEALYDGDQAKKGLKGLSNDLKKVSGISRIVVKPEIDTSDALREQKQAIKNFYAEISKEIGRGINVVNSKGNKVKLGVFQYLNGKDQVKDIVSVNDLKKAVESFSKMSGNKAAIMQNLYSGYFNRIVDFGQARIDQRRFEAKQRTRQQNRRLDDEDAEIRAAQKMLAIQKQISKERAYNTRRGGNLESSIFRQINLYHDLESAAKKAGDAQTQMYARNKITALNKQADAVGYLNTLFGRQGRIMTGLQSIAARYFSIYTVANFAKQVAETTGYFQQQQVALEGILGSASKARDTLSEIKNFALQSPFQTKDLVTFTKQLAAFGVKNNDLFPTVKSLADISAGLGVDMSRIILAYGQVKSAAVLRGQELRQFTEAGIPMVQKLSDKFSELNGKLVTTGEVFKLISERQVPFEMVASVLSDMTKEGGQFYKMQENITDTTYGQIQKLKDLWTIALDDIGKAAAGPINSIIKGFQKIVKNIQPIMTMVASTVIGSALGRGVTAIYRMIRALKIMRATAAATRGVMSTMLGGIGLVVGAIVGLVYNAKQKSQELTRTMADVANSYDKDTRRMISGLDSLSKKINSSAVGTKAYNDAISTLASNYGDFISNSTIKALQGEGEAARKAADEFANLAETLKIVINRQQQYNQLEAQGKAAAELSAKNTGEKLISDKNLNNLFRKSIQVAGAYGTNNSYTSQLLPGVQEYIDSHKGVTEDSLIKSVSGIIENALVEAAELGYDNTSKKGNKAIRKLFASRIKEIYGDFDPEMIKGIVDNAMSLADWKSYEASMSTYAAAASTTLGRITKPFKDLDKKLQSGKYNLSPTADSIDKEVTKEALALETLRKSIAAAKFPIQSGSKLDELLKNANPDDEAFAYNILQALEEFKNGRTNSQIGDISTIMRMFSERVGVRSGHAARIADRFRDRNSVVGQWRDNNNLANIVATFGAPTDDTYEKLREDLQKRISDTQKSIEEMTAGPYHKQDLDNLKEQLRALQLLQGDEYYGILSKQKKGGGSGRGGWRRFMSDLFSWVKEGKEEEKKLVEFSAGLTDQLSKQIESGQMTGTAVRAFWDNTPFKKFIDKMDEYGIESDVLSKDFLRNELTKMSVQQLEATGTINWQDVWEQLIKIINARADELSKDPKMKSTVDMLKTFSADRTMEGQKIFSRDKVDALIKEQLAELRKINAGIDKLSDRRSLYNRVSNSSNFLRANGIFGGGVSPFATDTSSRRIREFLTSNIGAGIRDKFDGNTLLARLIGGGNVSVGSLSAISDLREKLANITVNDMAGNTEEERQAAFETFKGVLSEFDGMLKQLTDDIASDFEKLMALRDPLTKSMDGVYQASNEFSEAIQRINKALIEGIQNPDGTTRVITKEEADRMRINAIQTLYNGVAKSLGGNGMQDYINLLYRPEYGGTDLAPSLLSYGSTGVTKRGYEVGMWLNNGTLAEKLGNMALATSGVRREDYKTDEDYQKAVEEATKGVMEFTAKLQLAGAIIKRLDGYIQGAAKFANDLIDAMEANNGLKKDDNDNYTYENDYSAAKQAINTIAEFSGGISSAIQSFLSGDIFGGIMNIGSSIAKLFENIFGLSDAKIQKRQDALISSNKSLERTLDELNHSLKGLAGRDRWENITNQIIALRDEAKNMRELEKEEVKKKHGDVDKAEDYRSQGIGKDREADDLIRGIQEEIFGTADELSTTLTDAFVEAFRNGENAARAWRDTVRGYVGDVLKDVLLNKVMAPKIDKVIDDFMGGVTDPDAIIDKFKNANNAVGLRNQLFNLGNEIADTFNKLPLPIQEMIAWNSDTSELSGGIQGITEDTARTLEGLSNSMLAQLVILNQSASNTEDYAAMQVSRLQDILVQQRAIRAATEGMNNAISEMRNGIRPLMVQMQ